MTLVKVGRSKQAKARKLGESVSYRVYLIGFTWGGFDSTYSYVFPLKPTETEIVRGAGDFQSVDDYQIVSVTTIQYTDGERRIVKTVRDWAKPDSGGIWCDANGC